MGVGLERPTGPARSTARSPGLSVTGLSRIASSAQKPGVALGRHGPHRMILQASPTANTSTGLQRTDRRVGSMPRTCAQRPNRHLIGAHRWCRYGAIPASAVTVVRGRCSGALPTGTSGMVSAASGAVLLTRFFPAWRQLGLREVDDLGPRVGSCRRVAFEGAAERACDACERGMQLCQHVCGVLRL